MEDEIKRWTACRKAAHYQGVNHRESYLPQPKRQLDTNRALERFGWRAEIRLDEGLRRTVDWMRSVP
jgi:nucleoside-diphosphate-sugar epimerase